MNSTAGGRTQLVGLIAAGLTMLALLFYRLFERLPVATLAAVVIAALVDLIDFSALGDFYRVYSGRLGRAYGFAARADFIAAVAAMLGVMIFGTLAGLFIGVVISLLLLLYRASRPPVTEFGKVPGSSGHFSDLDRHPENRRVEGIAVLRIEGGLFFANAAPVAAGFAARPDALAFAHRHRRGDGALHRCDGHGDARPGGARLPADGIRVVIARNIGQVRDVLHPPG